jgi:hypothetical protein
VEFTFDLQHDTPSGLASEMSGELALRDAHAEAVIAARIREALQAAVPALEGAQPHEAPMVWAC